MRHIEEMIEELDKEIGVRLKPYPQQVKLACTVPGIKPTAAAVSNGEKGSQYDRFRAEPWGQHLTPAARTR